MMKSQKQVYIIAQKCFVSEIVILNGKQSQAMSIAPCIKLTFKLFL